MITPLHEMAKETWKELIGSGFEQISAEQLPNIIEIIGHDSAFEYSYFVDNEDTEDNCELCTIISIPNMCGEFVKLVIENDKFESDLQYLKLINIDNDNCVIFNYPLREIDNFIFEQNDDEIQIYFQYRNMVVTLILNCLNIDDDF